MTRGYAAVAVLGAGTLGLLALAAPPASAAPAGSTSRVSVSSTGGEGNGLSGNAGREQVISGNGRYVAFFTEASNLTAGDTNDQWEVLVHDTVTGRTMRPAVSSSGVQGNDWSGSPALNEDGRYVVFASYASNLVKGDTNSEPDIFLRDLVAGTTSRVNVIGKAAQADGWSYAPSISGNGRYVAFQSTGHNLLPARSQNTGMQQIILRDRIARTTRVVSASNVGVPGNNHSRDAAVSANGRFVVFDSDATNLVRRDTNGQCWRNLGCTTDVFVRDLVANTTTRVSVRDDESESFVGGHSASISADGRYVAFVSNHLTADDATGGEDVYVRDQVAGTTTLVSRSTAGVQATDISGTPKVSANGSVVAFASSASGLVPGDTNKDEDVFVRNLVTGTTVRVSVSSSGGQGNGFSGDPDLSTDGSRVVFNSFATNLVAGDTNGMIDVFVRQS